MAIRDKIKKTFKSKKADESGSSTPSGTSPPKRKDIEYYKPHEIPKSKYKGHVDKEHQNMLDSYSFQDAFTATRRRPSQAMSGTFSPGGTMAQSRRPSYIDTAFDDDKAHGSHIESVSASSTPTEEIKNEEEDSNNDDDLSRAETLPARGSRAGSHKESSRTHLEKIGFAPTFESGRLSPQHDTPFTADELEKAMSRVTLTGRRGTVVALPTGITA